MKIVLPTFLPLILAAGLAAQSDPPEKQATASDKEKCSISGTVLRQDTSEPLKKSQVELINHGKLEDYVFDVTDAQGNFFLNDLTCASYTLRVSHPGFVQASYGQHKPSDPGAILTLAPGQKITGLVFKLERTAVITGRVFDENGELVQGAIVHVMRATGRGKRRDFSEVGRGLTDDLGEYRIFELDPGRDYLVATYDPWPQRLGFDAVPKSRSLRKGYPATYYPNTLDPSKAQALTLNPGDELPLVDFRMELVPMSTISGKILNPPARNATQGGINILLIPHGSNLMGLDSFESFSTTKDGSFILQRVPPGSYTVQASYMDRDTMEWSRALRPLEVADADVEGITLAFAPSNPVRGHLLWEGSKQGDLSSFSVFLSPTSEDSPGSQMQGVKPDGSFQFRSVNEGDYHPRIFSSNTDCYLKSARAGSSLWVDGRLSIHAGADSSLELVVSCRAPQVEGRVLTSDSLPAAGVFVVLVPESRFREQFSRYPGTTTDQNGHFLLKGVDPGDYKLFTWHSVEEGDWYDPDFLKPFEDKGVSIHLEEGDHKSIDLNLIEPPSDSSPKP